MVQTIMETKVNQLFHVNQPFKEGIAMYRFLETHCGEWILSSANFHWSGLGYSLGYNSGTQQWDVIIANPKIKSWFLLKWS